MPTRAPRRDRGQRSLAALRFAREPQVAGNSSATAGHVVLGVLTASHSARACGAHADGRVCGAEADQYVCCPEGETDARGVPRNSALETEGVPGRLVQGR
jgi:hypothetical protein